MTMQKSAIQKRIEAQLAAPPHTREDSNVNDKKPVPPSLAQFALEQLAEPGEQAAIDLTVQNVEILRAEIVKRDARIEDLEAQVEDTESRRENAARNSSAFEGRMGDLQVENGKLQARIDELSAELEETLGDWGTLRLELAALKAQQPSAGVVLPEPLKRGDEGGSGEYGAAMIRGFNACLREVARLNPCRAQAVPKGCTKPGCFPYCDCGGIDDAPSAHPEKD